MFDKYEKKTVLELMFQITRIKILLKKQQNLLTWKHQVNKKHSVAIHGKAKFKREKTKERAEEKKQNWLIDVCSRHVLDYR